MPRFLWLAPHRLAVENIRERLIASEAEACLAPGVQTFSRFFESMVSQSLDALVVLPRSGSRWLLRQAIREADRHRQLDLLSRVAERRGLVDALEQMIGQWKARGITAGQFEKFASSKRGTARDRELASVYARYEEQLSLREAADRDDLPRLAVELARDWEVDSSDRWQLVVVDGFASFSRYEREMFTHVVARADEIVVSLAVDPVAMGPKLSGEQLPGERTSDLAVAARGMLAWFQDRYPDLVLSPVGDRSKSSPPASLVRLRRGLFAPHGSPSSDDSLLSNEALATADRVSVVVGTNAQDELTQVTRRIKALLTSGRVAPRDIVVAAPALHLQQHRLREVFQSFGVPMAMATPQPVGEAPEMRPLLSLLSLADEDWPFRRVLEVVGNGLLTALDGPSSLASRWPTVRGAIEWIVRDLQIARKEKALLDTLARLAATTEEGASLRQQAAAMAKPMVEQIAAATGALPASATPGQWVVACEQLATALGLDLDPPDRPAWQQVREAAAAMERVSSKRTVTRSVTGAGPRGGPTKDKGATLVWSRAEWLSQLRDWCAWMPIPKSLEEEGRVRVLSVEAARHVAVPHLFIVGLSEQSFSSADSASGLYTEEQYDRLAAATAGSEKAPLSIRPYQRAMQLFYDLVCRAEESLTFSYPALDGAGQRMPPSPLLEEACRAFGSPLVEAMNAAPDITSLPPPGELARSPKDWRLGAVAELLAKKPARLGSMLANEATRGTAKAVVAAVAMSHHRATGDSFGPFEGLVPSPAARKWFAQNYGPEHLWSTSQLEGYANCPYQFFLEKVLHLEPLGDLALETDYRRRGTLAHRALVELHSRLDRLGSDARAPSEHDAAAFRATFDEAVDEVLEGFASFGIDGVLNELLAVEIRRWAEDYREQHVKYDATCREWDTPLTPTYFEIRFGDLRQRTGDEPEDNASTDQPLVVDLGTEQLLVGGRIDRIDVGQVGPNIVLQVIDYKTASRFNVSDEEVREGRKLQPALYAMAAAQIVSTSSDIALPLQSGYWVVRAQGFTDKSSLALHEVADGEVRPAADWESLETALKERLRAMVAGVRKGDFPMHNVDDQCTTRCDFKHVCRVHQIRSLGKTWPGEATSAAGSSVTGEREPTHD